MGALINLSIDLSKIDKSKIIEGKKGKYYNLTVSINDSTNNYGQNVSASDPQTKEQRDAGEDKNFIGNGRVFWTDGTIVKAEYKEQENKEAVSPNTDFGDGADDLPF